jgi:hypothetical protein
VIGAISKRAGKNRGPYFAHRRRKPVGKLTDEVGYRCEASRPIQGIFR